MTSPLLVTPTTPSAGPRDLDRAPSADAACDVCPHPRADHDRIAARFCSATGSGAITRGCVCRS